MTYQVRMLWAQALEDPQIRQMIVQKLRGAVTNQPPGVTIIFNTNIDPSRLKGRRHTSIDPMTLRVKRLDGHGGVGTT